MGFSVCFLKDQKNHKREIDHSAMIEKKICV